MKLKRILTLLVCLGMVMLVQAPEVSSAPKHKTTCMHTGNAWFFKMCSKKPKKCWLVYGIQYFMYNWDPQTRHFTFRCTLRYGRGLRKRQVKSQLVTLKRSVNCLGGLVFTWPHIRVDKLKKRYKYKCTCTIESLLLSRK